MFIITFLTRAHNQIFFTEPKSDSSLSTFINITKMLSIMNIFCFSGHIFKKAANISMLETPKMNLDLAYILDFEMSLNDIFNACSWQTCELEPGAWQSASLPICESKPWPWLQLCPQLCQWSAS